MYIFNTVSELIQIPCILIFSLIVIPSTSKNSAISSLWSPVREIYSLSAFSGSSNFYTEPPQL